MHAWTGKEVSLRKNLEIQEVKIIIRSICEKKVAGYVY